MPFFRKLIVFNGKNTGKSLKYFINDGKNEKLSLLFDLIVVECRVVNGVCRLRVRFTIIKNIYGGLSWQEK